MKSPKDSQTWEESFAQPDIWVACRPQLEKIAEKIHLSILQKQITEIVSAGAGTSAFIGDITASTTPSAIRFPAVITADIMSRVVSRVTPHPVAA